MNGLHEPLYKTLYVICCVQAPAGNPYISGASNCSMRFLEVNHNGGKLINFKTINL
jgi:hypothetical protein